MAAGSPPRPAALHPDLLLMDKPGRAVVRRTATALPGPRRVLLPRRAHHRTGRLDHDLERHRPALQVDQDRRPDHRPHLPLLLTHLRTGTLAMAILQRGLAVPCFAEDPMELARLGIEAERAGFDGFFLWDHMVFSNTGEGPPIVDPWLVLAVVAESTSRIRLGTMITPVPRRRPWQLARETTTLDRLSNGRLILGVGIGSPAYGDFGIFHEPSGERERAELLDEGLDVLAGLWSGEKFSYQGSHFTVDPVRFTPTPVQRPRIPVWVGGVLPAARPIARAARWDV